MAGHEFPDGLGGSFRLEKDVSDGPSEGHFDMMSGGQIEDAFGGGNPFDDGLDLLEGLIEGDTPADEFTQAAIPAMRGDTGGHEVAKAGKPGEGFLSGAESDTEAGNFDQSAGQESGFGVIADLKAIDHPGGKGNDIFHSPGQFHPGNVVIGIHPKAGSSEDGLNGPGVFDFSGGGDKGGGQISGHLQGDTRAGEGHHLNRAEEFVENLGRPEEGVVFDALGHGDKEGIFRGRGGQTGPDAAKILGRHGVEDNLRAFEGDFRVGGNLHGRGNAEPGKEFGVFPGLGHLPGILREDGPEDNLMVFAMKEQAAHRGHRSVADDGDTIISRQILVLLNFLFQSLGFGLFRVCFHILNIRFHFGAFARTGLLDKHLIHPRGVGGHSFGKIR